MPATAVSDMIKRLIQGILRDPAEAEAYSENPTEYLAAHNVADQDLSGLDMRAIVCEAAEEVDLPAPAKALLEDYGKAPSAPPPPAKDPSPDAGRDELLRPVREPASAPDKDPGPDADPGHDEPAKVIEPPPVYPPPAMQPLEIVEQHISYATYVTYQNSQSYESNTNIVQNLIDNSTNIDNSSNVSLDVDGDLTGDVSLINDVTNVNATGDGAVAAGEDIEDSVVNTGSGDAIQTGDIDATDSAVAIGGDATNTQDRSETNVDIDQSVDIDNSFNEDSIVDTEGVAVQIDDSFNDTDNSRTDNSTTDNSTTDNSVDRSIDVDVTLPGGRTAPDPDPDPGYGRGDDDGKRDTNGEGPADGAPQDDPSYADLYEEKYGRPPAADDPQLLEEQGRAQTQTYEPQKVEDPVEELEMKSESPVVEEARTAPETGRETSDDMDMAD